MSWIASASCRGTTGRNWSSSKARNYTYRPVLIHVNGVSDAVVEAGYFDEIVDFSGAFTASNGR